MACVPVGSSRPYPSAGKGPCSVGARDIERDPRILSTKITQGYATHRHVEARFYGFGLTLHLQAPTLIRLGIGPISNKHYVRWRYTLPCR